MLAAKWWAISPTSVVSHLTVSVDGSSAGRQQRRMMRGFTPLIGAALALALVPAQRAPAAQPAAAAVAAPAPSYASLARLTLAAPVIVRAQVRKPGLFSRPQVTQLPNGRLRVVMEADLQSVIQAPLAIRTPIQFVWEGQGDAKGRAPDLSRQTFLMFLNRPATAAEPFTLVRASGLAPWSEPAEATVRRIIGEALQSPSIAKLQLSGVREIMALDADPPYAASYQLLLDGRSGEAVALQLDQHPQAQRDRVQVSFDDTMVAAQAVQRDTLLWYAIACTLPRQSADRIAAAAAVPDQAGAAASAYARLVNALGTCN
jgi:hypothetical protein